MIRAGDLDERILIEQETRTPNGQGGSVVAWAPLPSRARPWAMVRGMSGDEAMNAAIERSVGRWRIVLRRRSDLTPAMRVRWAGMVLDIKAVMPLPSDPSAFTLLICESGMRVGG